MATLKQAILDAKADPSSQKAQALKQAIVSGKMDSIAQTEGIDLTAFKSKLAAPRKAEAQGGTDTSFLDLPGNILPSAGRAVKAIGSAVLNPIDTAKALGSVAVGAAEKLIPGEQESEKSFDAVTQFFGDRYGSLHDLKQTIINDPAGFAFDLSTVLGAGGGALKLAGKGAEVVGAAKTAEGLSTAANIAKTAAKITDPLTLVGKAVKSAPVVKAGEITKEAIKGAAKGAGEQLAGYSRNVAQVIKETPELFAKAEAGEITRGGLGEKVLNTIKYQDQQLSGLGKEYDNLRTAYKNSQVSVPHEEINKALRAKGLIAEGGVLKETGKLSSNLSEIDAAQVQKAVSLIEDVDKVNISQVLNLRNKLDDLISWDKGVTDKGEAIIRKIRSSVDDAAKNGFEGLRELDAQYAPEIQKLRIWKKDWFKPNGELKDNAISKIANASGKGKEQILERLESLSPGISDEIKALNAYEATSSVSNKPGTYLRSLAGLASGSYVGGPLGIAVGIGSLIATSPEVTTRLLEAFGKAEKATPGMIVAVKEALGNLNKLTPDQQVFLAKFMENITLKGAAQTARAAGEIANTQE
jgi:hypothetical protein